MNRIEELIASSQAGDERAKELLVTENTGLIWSVTRRFLGRGVDADDLYQLGCIGFLKAIDGFNLEYGTQFSTYAVPKIAGEIRRFLRDDGAVKVSRSIKEQASTIRSVRNQLSAALGREPTIQEISRQTGFSPEEIALAETATAATESIQRETGEEGFSLENILTDTEKFPPELSCAERSVSAPQSIAANIFAATAISTMLYYLLAKGELETTRIAFSSRRLLMKGIAGYENE